MKDTIIEIIGSAIAAASIVAFIALFLAVTPDQVNAINDLDPLAGEVAE